MARAICLESDVCIAKQLWTFPQWILYSWIIKRHSLEYKGDVGAIWDEALIRYDEIVICSEGETLDTERSLV